MALTAGSVQLDDSGDEGGFIIDSIDTSANNGDISIIARNGINPAGLINAGTGHVTLNTPHGSITDTSSLSQIYAGSTTLIAGTTPTEDPDSHIWLFSSTNEFGNLSATVTGTDPDQNALIAINSAAAGLTLGNITTHNGNVDLTAIGTITQANGTTINTGSGHILMQFDGGVFNQVGTAGIITSGLINLFQHDGAMSLSGTGNDFSGGLLLQEANGEIIPNITIFNKNSALGSLAIPYNVLNGFTLTAPGVTSSADTNLVTYLNTYIVPTLNTEAAADLSVTAANYTSAFNVTQALGAASVHNFTLGTNSNINQFSGLTISGDLSLNARTGDISLTSADNNFGGGNVTLIGNNVMFYSDSNLALDTITTAGYFTLTAAGDIVQTTAGALHIGGGMRIDAGTHAITLDNANNEFSTIIIGHSGLTAGDVAFGASSDIQVGQADEDPETQLSSLAINTYNAGDITQTGALKVATATLTAGEHNITLDNAENQLSDFAIVSGGNVTLTNSIASRINASSVINGDFILTSHGNITQKGALNVDGTTTLTANNGDIILMAANQMNGLLTLSANNIALDNIVATLFGNVTSTGNFISDNFSAVTQATNTAFTIGGTTTLRAQSNDVTLTNANHFQGAVSIIGNTVLLNQNSGENLTLQYLSALGNVVVQDQQGTLTFVGSTPTITLRSNEQNQKVTLSAAQFQNQNTGADSPIDLGAASNSVWDFYVENLEGNTFNSGSNTLTSGNQAIWGTRYGTSITQTGNRYIFATPEHLTLTPTATPFTVSKTLGAPIALPAPSAGNNFQVGGFVDASQYDHAFTQDTLANVDISDITFTSTGAAASATAGDYAITLTGLGTVATGYTIHYDDNASFGELIVTPTTTNPATITNTLTPTSVLTPPSDTGLASLQQQNCSLQSSILNCSVTLPAGTSIDTWLADNAALFATLTPQQRAAYETSLRQQCSDSTVACTANFNVNVSSNDEEI